MYLSQISCSLWHLVSFQTCNQEGSLSFHLCWGPVSVLRMHRVPEQKPSGEPRLQLSPYNAEQGVSEEGALRGRGEIPLKVRQRKGSSRLYLCQSLYLLLLEGTHPDQLSQWHATVHVVFVLKCTKFSGMSNVIIYEASKVKVTSACFYWPIYCHNDDIIIDTSITCVL